MRDLTTMASDSRKKKTLQRKLIPLLPKHINHWQVHAADHWLCDKRLSCLLSQTRTCLYKCRRVNARRLVSFAMLKVCLRLGYKNPSNGAKRSHPTSGHWYITVEKKTEKETKHNCNTNTPNGTKKVGPWEKENLNNVDRQCDLISGYHCLLIFLVFSFCHWSAVSRK